MKAIKLVLILAVFVLSFPLVGSEYWIDQRYGNGLERRRG